MRSSLLVAVIAATTAAITVAQRHAPTVPMAPGVTHPGVINDNAPKHWRLVKELASNKDNTILARLPLNTIYYDAANKCAADGSKLPWFVTEPPSGTFYLIACIPYHDGEDTDTETPL